MLIQCMLIKRYLVHINGNDFNQEGLPMTFLPWDSGQLQGGKDENCMILLIGKFHDVPCDSFALKFLCETFGNLTKKKFNVNDSINILK